MNEMNEMNEINELNRLKQTVEMRYPIFIKFNRKVTGDEPFPRSSNIKEMRWATDGRDYALFVEFFGYAKKDGSSLPDTGYIYKVNDDELWEKLVEGSLVEGSKESSDSNHRSTGQIFHQEIRNKVAFDKVY